MSIPAQLKYIILTVLFTVATVNFARTTMSILRSSERLDNLKSDVNLLENKKVNLEEDIKYKQTNDYIEERARNALNLIKPGEKVYVSSNVLGKSVSSDEAFIEKKTKSNLEQWYELFF